MTDQTVAGAVAAGASEVLTIAVSASDRAVLRDLALGVAELAARPIEAEKRDLWYRHNALLTTRPLVFCDPENGWNEIIRPSDLVCEGDLARQWEMRLRKELFWGARMCDDRVVEACFPVPHVYSESDWGLHETRLGGDHGGSYTWDAPVKDIAADLPRLRFPTITLDQDATDRLFALAEDVVGDILPVIRRTAWWWTLGMTWTLIRLRGLSQIMYDMVDDPANLHRLMAFLRAGHLARLDALETGGLLTLNNDGAYVGSGGFGWSHELPAADFAGRARPCDMWGFAESQETIGVSPAMFAEFVLPYQLPLLDRFGLNCYGCCEPVDKRWEHLLRIPRLRRVSVSAWADVNAMAEALGDRYIFSWKPRPADLATEHFDAAAVRSYVRSAVRAARDCRLEIIMKDNHTIGNDPDRVVEWVRIVREEVAAL